MICGSGGSKSRLAKAAGAAPCGQMRDGKVHAVAARSTFPSQNAQSTPTSDHFWKLRCRKSARRCGAKHIGKLRYRKSVRRCGAKHISKSKMQKNGVRNTFGRSDVVLRGRRRGLCTLSKVSKTWAKRQGFVAVSDTMAWDIWRGSGKMHFAWQAQYKRRGRCVRRSGRRFSERGCFLEHEIFRFAKMILHDRCSTSYDLASLFRGRRNTLEVWTGKIANRIGTRPSALHSTFHYWRMLPTWKIEEVSQTCFVFDVIKFKSCGGLTELLRFWRCQVQKLRKSRRIASSSNLQIDRSI